MVTQKIFLTLLTILFFTGVDCKKDVVDPPPPTDDVKPGRRDYVWTVDTLKIQSGDMMHLYKLWGSSPKDIWAVGNASSSVAAKWHYDGNSWHNDPARISSNLQTVFGFSSNNVWAGDSPGNGIYHFDGNQWIINYRYSVVNEFIGISDIWGEQPNNIYAVGSIYNSTSNTLRGIILSYNGYSWNSINLNNPNIDFHQIRKDKTGENNYFLSGLQFQDIQQNKTVEKGFKFDGKEVIEIYSSTTQAFTVNEINGRVYFTQPGRKQILNFSDNKLQVWKDFSQTDFTLGLLWGRSEKDIFTQAFKSNVYGVGHYNGSDWELLYPLSKAIDDIMVFDSEIFILTNDSYPIIIHGTLK